MASYISNLLGSSNKPTSWLPGSSNSGGLVDTVKNAVSQVNPFASTPAPTSFLDKAKSFVPGLSPSGPTGLASKLLGTKDNTFFTKLYQSTGMSSTLATVLGYVSYILYQQFINKDPRTALEFMKSHLGQTLSLIPGASKIPGISSLLAGGIAGGTPSVAAKNALATIRKARPSMLSKLNPLNWDMFNKKKIKENKDDEAYQAGEPYGDPEVVSTGLADDLKAVGLKGAPKDLEVLISVVKNKGKPLDDRKMDVEKLIALAASLPTHSKARKKLTGVLIDTLWSSLQHPPLSYLGDKYAYRSPDGSNNNPLYPNLGKAGSPYARTVKKTKHLKGCQPDPGMLFDFLMARTDTSFKENPAGVSSMLFYHATIIIHDIFNSNRFDHNISDTSSYLDLAPLYGSNLEDQLKIRTMKNGLLKPDTFSEKRLLGQPPGVNVVLVMYSRFHNYCAETLLKINEYDRFSLPKNLSSDEQQKQALAKQDEDLFQTARLIVNGLYINICLYDYLRGLTNTHHSASDWTLDPRVEVDRMFDAEGVPRGCGNQISAEFNLLYRFHSTISLRDEKWINEFMGSLFPDINKPFDQLTPQEFIQGLFRFEQSIPKEPEKREFAGLKRGADGKFNDADLVKIMKESCEDPAGLFGPRMVPKALKMVEIAGILSSRKWQLASLNEMRDFFKLKRHDVFEDVNPDPEIADLLRKFYQHPDMIEMYPGLFIEDAKPRMDPGCGGCPPYTVGRAVFSDAVTLVRSDRFLTLDYSPSTLTNWGMEEVKYDLRVMGGSMYYKLFHRALPGWFPYNSLHIMQPMFTRKMNEQIAREIGTIDLYTTDDPKPPKRPVIVANAGTIQKILADQTTFKVTWGKPFSDLFPGKKDYSGYMLAGDKKENTAQRNLVGGIMYASPDIAGLISDTTLQLGEQFLRKNTFVFGTTLNQVDIVRDVAIPVNTRILSDLFCLDLKTDDNPTGSLTTNQMFKYLSDVRCWGFENTDVGMAWKRRMWAQEGCKALEASTKKSVAKALGSAAVGAPSGIISGAINTTKSILGSIPVVGGLLGGASGKGASTATPAKATLKWVGANIVKEIAAAGQTPEQIVDVSYLNAVGGIGVIVGLFASILEYFLKPENVELWAKVQSLATTGSSETINKALRPYILEAQRLTSNQQDLRFCVDNVTIDGQQFKPGDAVLTLLGLAGRNPASVPDPGQFKLDRPAEAYLHYGWGPHKCLGREVGIAYATGMIRLVAATKGLRQAPDKMGQLKVVMMGPGNQEKLYMNDSWSYLTKDPTTWTLHFDGYGKGVYQRTGVDVAEGRDLKTIFAALKEQAKDEPQEVPDHIKDADRIPAPPIDAKSDEARAVINAPSQAPPTTSQVNGAQSPSQTNGETENGYVKQTNGSNIIKTITSEVKTGVDTAANEFDQAKNTLLRGLKKESPNDTGVSPEIDSPDRAEEDATNRDIGAPALSDIASKPETSVTNGDQNGIIEQPTTSNSRSAPTGKDAETTLDTSGADVTSKTPATSAPTPAPDMSSSGVSSDTTTTTTTTAPTTDTGSGNGNAADASTKTWNIEAPNTAPIDVAKDAISATNEQSTTDTSSPAAAADAETIFDSQSGVPSSPSTAAKQENPTNTNTSTPAKSSAPTPAGLTPATTAPPVMTTTDSFAEKPLKSAPTNTAPTNGKETSTSNIAPSPAVAADGFDPNRPVSTKVQQGTFSRNGDYTRSIGLTSFDQPVKFSQQYDMPPQIALSISAIDISASGSSVNFFQSAKNVTRTGFTWSVSIGGTKHWMLESNWIAIPNDNDFKDVIVAVFDSRQQGNKLTSSSKFTTTLNINSIRGSAYDRAPTVVTWLTGFDIQATNNRIPDSIKIRSERGDNVSGSSIDVAVNCNNINSVSSVQVNVILIPDSSSLSTFYHNTYDTTPNLPFIGPPQSRTAVFFPRAFLSTKRIQNTIGLAGFDFQRTGTSIRYKSSVLPSLGSYSATIGTWYDGVPNSITGWIVTSEQ